MSTSKFTTKILFTVALAASAFLLSENANSQTINSKIPNAEASVKMAENLTLQMRKDLLKKLKEENKMNKLMAKQEKEIKKLEKVNQEIDKLCTKLQSKLCQSQPSI